jgi:F0F1-type ATP synthase epsilon subunit
MPSRDEAGYYLAVSNGIADVLKKNVDITIEM